MNLKNRKSRIKKAKDIANKIYLLYSKEDRIGDWELDKAADAIHNYIKELEKQ